MEENSSGMEQSFESMVQKLKEVFREEAYELLGEFESALLELEGTPTDTELIGRVFRVLHTIKGSGGSCGLDDVAAFAHEIETFFDLVRNGKIVVTHEIIGLTLAARDRIKEMFDAHYLGGKSDEALRRQVLASFRGLLSSDGGEQEPTGGTGVIHQKQNEKESRSSIRVVTDKLDSLVNLVGELVTIQARLSQTASGRGIPEFISIAEAVERLTSDLREITMNIRMLPIGSLFGRFKRLARDLSSELGKDVDVAVKGAETELDKTVIERLNDPLVHLIRNCIDHGIEAPDLRQASGKPRTGTVSLAAAHVGAQVQIEISDDGAGLDQDRIRAKAIDLGIHPEGETLSSSEIFACIFTPGFSTASTVTNVSGRGVGLDVVKRAVDALGGTIEISSEQGAGTTITLKLPLTLAIIDGFLTSIDQEHYIFPLSLVEECVELTPEQTGRKNGSRLIMVRGALVPYIRLREQLALGGERPAIEQVVIVRQEQRRIGFVVDRVVGGHQTVIKNLGNFYKNVEGISGATILGDGSVALILDLTRLTAMAERDQVCVNC